MILHYALQINLFTSLALGFLKSIKTLFIKPLSNKRTYNETDQNIRRHDLRSTSKHIHIFTISIFSLTYAFSSHAQLLINDAETGGETAATLVGHLVSGDNIIVSNITTSGNPRCLGAFSGGNGILGFDEGIILGSGSAIDAAGPNVSDETTSEFFSGGDSFLTDLLNGEPTFDACVLEFSFQCEDTDTISIEYVMGSEEYNEFVEEGSNDVFGFALNGTNIATLPNSGGLAVSIENVNCGNPYDPNSTAPYCDLFINNDLQDGGGQLDIEADGLTTVLRAEQNIPIGSTNTMKFAVGDVLDEAFDTWVFLRSGSFQCSGGGGTGPVDVFSTFLSTTCTVWNDTSVYYNEDIVSFNEDTQSVEMVFDGSDVGLSYANVDAFTQLSTGEIILSFTKNFEVPGLGYVRDEDLIKFTPAALGETTTGTFEMYFDGSEHGLGDCGGDIDALDIVEDLATGEVLIYFSTTSSVEINGVWYADEDVIEFNPSTSAYNKYFDGSDIGISHTDIDAFKINDDGTLLLSLKCSTTIEGIGDVPDEDILKFTPTSTGETTSGTLEISISGLSTGLMGNYFDFNGVDRVLQQTP